MKHIAHRGYSAQYPENTLLAIEQAMVIGAEMIEIDIALSKDREIVVIHDETLDRTTSARGRVCDFESKALQALDAGSWKGTKFKDQRIPTLDQVLACIDGQVALNVEIKAHAVHLDPDRSIEIPLLKTLETYTMRKTLHVSSFEPLALHRLRKQDPKLSLCYLVEGKVSQEQRDEMQYLDASALHLDINTVDQDEIALAQSMGLWVRAFTVKEKFELDKAKRLGLDGVFVNELDVTKLV